MLLESTCASSLAADLCTQFERSFPPKKSRWIMRQSEKYTSRACRRLQSWTRTLPRAELRTEGRQWSCELPDLPASSEYAPPSNGSYVDDVDYGAFVHRATAHANQRNQSLQTDSPAKRNPSTSPKRKGKEEDSEQEKVTVATVNIADHRPRDHF